MDILKWFKKVNDTSNPGALVDNRTEKEKVKDFFFEEAVAMAAPVDWVEKSPTNWRSFSIRNQDGSGSCVKQTIAKLAEVLYFLKSGEKVPFSAGFYKYRVNAPSGGMIGTDAFDIWMKKGITSEALLPSQNMRDSQMDAIKESAFAKDTAIAFKAGGYLQYTPKISFDDIASTILLTGKGVMVWFFFARDEWTDTPSIKYPSLDLHGSKTVRHSVTAVDAVLYKGKQYLVIEDSWGNFNQWAGKRLISREFFEKRNFFAAYPINFKFLEDEVIVKPKYKFLKDLKGPSNIVDKDVVALQDILKYEKLFPSNIASTGKYLAITAKGVLEFQKKYKIAPVSDLEALGGMTVGVKTREALNQLYG